MKTKMILLVSVFILGIGTASKAKAPVAEQTCGNFHITCGDGNHHYGMACGDSVDEMLDDVRMIAETLC